MTLPSIIVHNDPQGIKETLSYRAPVGTLLLDWFIETYGHRGFPVPTRIFENAPALANEVDPMSFLEDGRPLLDGEVIHLVHTPQEFATVVAIVGVVIGVGSAVFLRPSLPNLETPEYERTIESANNRLTGQTNIARTFERIPDIYGKNRVYPDLGAKTYTEFINHIKYVTEFLVIGRGSFLVEDLKSGETLISDIEGSDAEIFGPFTRPAELLDVTTSNEVNGQELAGPNDPSNILDVTASDVTFFAGTGFRSKNTNFSQFTDLTDGDTFTVTGSTSNDGTYTFDDVAYFPEFGDYIVNVDESTTSEAPGATVTFEDTAGKPSGYGPFIVPGGQEAVWIDIHAPRGLQEIDDVDRFTVAVSFDVLIEEETSPSVWATDIDTTVRIEDNTQSARFYTFKFEPSDPLLNHRITVTRTTNTVLDSAKQIFDLTRWASLAGVDDLTVAELADFGDVTTIKLLTKATEGATAAQQRKFNAVVTRILPGYDTGTQLPTAAVATAKAADAAIFMLTDSLMGNKPISEIDIDELYAIQDTLDADVNYGDTLGRFCYSFSNKRTPLLRELQTCLGAARILVYREGERVRFARDETKTNRRTVFTRRNKAPDKEKKSYTFRKPNDHDAVAFEWIDESTHDANTITFPLAGGENIKRVRGAGIKNYKQAYNRAVIEYEKRLRMRQRVTTQATIDGFLTSPLDLIENEDLTTVKSQGGGVVNHVDPLVETSEPIDFRGQPGGTAVFTAANGDSSAPIPVSPRGDSVNGFSLDSAVGFPLVLRGDNGYQIESRYLFLEDGSSRVTQYIVDKLSPTGNGYVNLRLVNYDPSVYDIDGEDPPPQ